MLKAKIEATKEELEEIGLLPYYRKKTVKVVTFSYGWCEVEYKGDEFFVPKRLLNFK